MAVIIFAAGSCATTGSDGRQARQIGAIDEYGLRMEFYSLEVPAQHPEHEVSYELVGALLRPESERRRKSERLTVFVQGGPGEAAIGLIDALPDFFAEMAADQDVLVIDQRGAGFSGPALGDYENHDVAISDILRDLPEELARLVHEDGFPLEGINSREAARDIIAWADALGYEYLDLYGISYGTRIAMTAAAHYPDRVNSLILDAPVIPEHRFYQEWPLQLADGMDAFFASVAERAAAGGGFSGFREEYLEARAGFAAEPMEIPFRHPAFPEVEAIEVDDKVLDMMVFTGLYQSLLIPYMPRVLRGVFEGSLQRRQSLGLVAQLLIGNTYHGTMLYHLWIFNDTGSNIDWEAFAADIEAIEDRYPGLAYIKANFMAFQQEIAASGLIAETAPEVHPLPPADMPVLILAGELDPAVSARDAEALHAALPESSYVMVPQAGHGVAYIYTALPQALRLFLADPDNRQYLDELRELQAPGYLRIF